MDVEELVREHMPLARSLAWRYRDRGEQQDDLVQVAYLGLVKAARNYRPDEGSNFEAYAVPTITGELRRHFRDHGWDIRPPRRLQELRAQTRQAEEALSHELARLPSSQEVADWIGVDIEQVLEADTASQGYDALSLDAPPPGHDECDWSGADSIADVYLMANETNRDDVVLLVDALTLQPLLARLNEREQLILALRFYGNYTQQQIADRIGVTQMQVSRLITRMLERLRAAALEDMGGAWAAAA